MCRKISVIVPVYNSEIYIRDCVNSVIKQSFPDFELILIDDGSDDRSAEICETLCKKDKRIRVIHQRHKGVSAARNAGIDAASGKYLFFLDSDDMIHPQLLEVLYRLQEKNHTEIATLSLYYAEEGKFQRPLEWKFEKPGIQDSLYLSNADALKTSCFGNSKIMMYAVGGKLILRDALGAVRFDEGMTQGEDTWFIYQLLIGGAKVSVLLRNWYYYRKNKKAVIHRVETCKDRYRAMRYIRDYQIESNKIEDALEMEWVILSMSLGWLNFGKVNNDFALMKYVKNLIAYEESSGIYSQLKWDTRVLFRVGIIYYPLYHWMDKYSKRKRRFCYIFITAVLCIHCIRRILKNIVK